MSKFTVMKVVQINRKLKVTVICSRTSSTGVWNLSRVPRAGARYIQQMVVPMATIKGAIFVVAVGKNSLIFMFSVSAECGDRGQVLVALALN
jgi:hypothetical protein